MADFKENPGNLPSRSSAPGGYPPAAWYPPPPYSYGYAPYGNYPQPPKRNGLAIASLVLGILSLLFFCLFPIMIIPAIVGVTLGAVGLKKAEQRMAIAGLIMNMLALIVNLILIVYYALFFGVIFFAIAQDFHYYNL